MRGTFGVRRLMRQMIDGPLAFQVGKRAEDAGLDHAVVRGTLELALRMGDAMLSLGAGAADVTAMVHRTTRVFCLDTCQVEVNFTAITVSYDPGGANPPLTLMRVVRTRVSDYGRLAQIIELAKDVGAEVVPLDHALERLEEAHTSLDQIVQAPRPYRRWVVTVVLSVLAAAVAVLLGGGVSVALVAAATTALIDRVVWKLDRWGLPPFFVQGTGAAIATLVAVGLYLVAPHLSLDLAAFPPSLVVASGIVVLLAGTSLVGAAGDAISGHAVTAGGRTFEVVMLTLGIVIGIGGVLDVARRAGVPLEVLDTPANSASPIVQALSAAVVAAAWGVASYARPRAAAAAAIAGGVAWTIFMAGRELGLGPAAASGVSALVIGFLGEYLGPRLRVPPILISVCGIVPLLPGLAIYRALFQLVNKPEQGLALGVAGLLGAAMTGVALAAGVTLGEFFAAPLRRGARRRLEAHEDWPTQSPDPDPSDSEDLDADLALDRGESVRL